MDIVMKQLDATLATALGREFYGEGVTCIRQVLARDELASLADEINACIQDDRQLLLDYGSKGKVLNGFFLWTRSDNLKKLLCDSPLPAIAAQLMGSKKINLFCDNVFIKEPDTPDHPSPWHSDQPHWIVHGRQVVTFWLALDHVTWNSGAVQFIRGSHLWDLSRDGYYRIDDEYEPICDIEKKRHLFDIIHYDLEPGDMTAHHGMTLHCAFGNQTSDRRRRGYAIRYTGDDVVYEPNSSFEAPVPVELVRGAPLDSSLFPVAFRGG
jgi:ectoine hydroxylase-related dioxygenase (phytanoyl-CoA dioxygenase family)